MPLPRKQPQAVKRIWSAIVHLAIIGFSLYIGISLTIDSVADHKSMQELNAIKIYENSTNFENEEETFNPLPKAMNKNSAGEPMPPLTDMYIFSMQLGSMYFLVTLSGILGALQRLTEGFGKKSISSDGISSFNFWNNYLRIVLFVCTIIFMGTVGDLIVGLVHLMNLPEFSNKINYNSIMTTEFPIVLVALIFFFTCYYELKHATSFTYRNPGMIDVNAPEHKKPGNLAQAFPNISDYAAKLSGFNTQTSQGSMIMTGNISAKNFENDLTNTTQNLVSQQTKSSTVKNFGVVDRSSSVRRSGSIRKPMPKRNEENRATAKRVSPSTVEAEDWGSSSDNENDGSTRRSGNGMVQRRSKGVSGNVSETTLGI